MTLLAAIATLIAPASAQRPIHPTTHRPKALWSLQPVRRPAIPVIRNPQSAIRNPIDAFILQKLNSQHLTINPPADRCTLIRRAYFDLIGLPPKPEEVEAFVNDRSPDAWPKLVDRLLASPHYGERWGRHWLDVARYADTKGYVFFQESKFPWSWTYRDYVIRAFNEDLPYDRFIIEQLAADKLPLGDDKRPLAALGFITLGGRFMNNAQDIVDDRIDVVTRGLQGLTVACARCHDHKFDPISQKDYYGLYGVFASCYEPVVPPLLGKAPGTPGYEKFAKELAAREAKLNEFVLTQHNAMVTGARTRAADYLMAAHAIRGLPKQDDFMLLSDGPDLNPTMIRRWSAYIERMRAEKNPVWSIWCALEDVPAAEFEKRAAGGEWRAAAGKTNPLVAKAFEGKTLKSLADAAKVYGELLSRIDQEWQTVQKTVRANRAPTVFPDAPREEIRQVLYGQESPPMYPFNPLGDLNVFPDRPSQAKLQELLKAVESYRSAGPDAPPRPMVTDDLPEPVRPHVFLRGNPNNLGEEVPRAYLTAVCGANRKPFTQGSGRLELAQAIVDPSNPLTARVMVNRIWLQHFGEGLVHTPSDFGTRADPPTHPELLDWLAATFMTGDSGRWTADGAIQNPKSNLQNQPWSIKSLHRLIMLSSTYQQASDDRADGKRVDPENRLLWKFNRQRLDFEAMRDALLSASGQLDEAVGGPSVDVLAAPYSHRRSVYAYVDRLSLPGSLRTFDFPSPDTSCPRRDETTIAPQALFLMNHPFVRECAQKLAARPDVVAEPDMAKRVSRIYAIVYGRGPAPDEVELARRFLGDAPKPVDWERFAQAVLESNEFAFID